MKTYYQLTKPGIVYGNAIPAVAAFLYASQSGVDYAVLAAMLIGLMAVVAGSCVANNIIDQDIDMLMERTRARALPTGQVSVAQAGVFSAVLLAIGFLLLFLFTNLVTLAVALFGVVVYVGIYTPLKRMSVHSTVVGAFAGAVPPVVGYTTEAQALDMAALLLFLVLVCWQMVHFFAISIVRESDYRSASLPVASVSLGIWRTKALMVVYAVLFACSMLALGTVENLSVAYFVVAGGISLAWLVRALRGLRTPDDRKWARGMFLYSILALLLFCGVLAIS